MSKNRRVHIKIIEREEEYTFSVGRGMAKVPMTQRGWNRKNGYCLTLFMKMVQDFDDMRLGISLTQHTWLPKPYRLEGYDGQR